MKRNEAKKWMLTALSDMTEPTEPSIIAAWLDQSYNVTLSVRAASMELLRLQRQGLAHRMNGKYSISQKGQERLQWIRSQSPC